VERLVRGRREEEQFLLGLRRDCGVCLNGYFWSAFVDVYARGGDYRGAESVLYKVLEEARAEYNVRRASHPNNRRLGPPLAVPPLSVYISFFLACHKLILRMDVHPSIKSEAANRAWLRWKEMCIHSVAPYVVAYVQGVVNVKVPVPLKWSSLISCPHRAEDCGYTIRSRPLPSSFSTFAIYCPSTVRCVTWSLGPSPSSTRQHLPPSRSTFWMQRYGSIEVSGASRYSFQSRTSAWYCGCCHRCSTCMARGPWTTK
jgi:hypothetical protein